MCKKSSLLWIILVILVLAGGISAAMAHWTEGSPNITFWTSAAISIPCLILAVIGWNWGGRGKSLAVMMFLAFVLRMAFGLATVNLLPIYGHPDEYREQKGYLFDDAWRRDEEAWTLVQQEDITFKETLTRSYNNDQYGGLIAMTIWLYKYISPDARRFTLIMELGSYIAALGLPFLWKGLRGRWGNRVALIACWIYTLYPDALFYGGAPMREPFLNGIICVVFWALATLREHKARSAVIVILCAVCCLPFSSMVSFMILCISVLWVWAEFLIPRSNKWLWGGIILIVICILAGMTLALDLFKEWVHFDIFTTENGSGWVEKVIGEIGGQFRSIFVAIYGLTQPVLPAILVYPVAPACDLAHGPCTTIYWKVVGIFRSAGWYILIPFLFYAIFSTFRIKDKKEKTLMIVNAIFVIVWLFISSLRAGGDQIDNPRYRVIFLPWLTFMAAWGIDHALKLRDWWLVRWIAIEIIFLGFFTQWYYSRYSGNAIRRFPFWRTVIYILLCSGVVFAEGIIHDRMKKKE